MINKILKADQCWRTEEEGVEIETLLDSDPPPPLPKEAWRHMKGWYKSADNHGSPSAQITL